MPVLMYLGVSCKEEILSLDSRVMGMGQERMAPECHMMMNLKMLLFRGR